VPQVEPGRNRRERLRVRRLLATMTERDLQDIGSCCWSKIADEINKPFWLK
jgi:uncharacterized protein YjiS (DUF1127 family)